MSFDVSLREANALAYCLRKLHNHCMSKNEIEHCDKTKIDSFLSSVNGSTPIKEDSNGNCAPNKILSGGNYSDDFVRRKVPTNYIPRERTLQIIR